MILYRLRCAEDHEFEGWFKSGDAYDRQSAAGHLSCPVCGGSEIAKAPMAPRLGRGSRVSDAASGGDVAAPSDQDGKSPSAMAMGGDPARMMAALRQVREAVEKTCDYVGDRFPEEARRIHYGETEKRGIYGESSPKEAKALKEEGIEVSQIPWVPKVN